MEGKRIDSCNTPLATLIAERRTRSIREVVGALARNRRAFADLDYAVLRLMRREPQMSLWASIVMIIMVILLVVLVPLVSLGVVLALEFARVRVWGVTI